MVYDILKNINQAAANAWDGSHDERFIADKEKPRKVGLNREMGDLIFDSRLVDGFKVKIRDNILTVSYQAEISSKDFHKKDIKKDEEYLFKVLSNKIDKKTGKRKIFLQKTNHGGNNPCNTYS